MSRPRAEEPPCIKDEVLNAVEGASGIKSDIFAGSNTRKAEVVVCRDVAAYILRRFCWMNLTDIAETLGTKTHAAVYSALKRMDENLQKNTMEFCLYAKTMSLLFPQVF